MRRGRVNEGPLIGKLIALRILVGIKCLHRRGFVGKLVFRPRREVLNIVPQVPRTREGLAANMSLAASGAKCNQPKAVVFEDFMLTNHYTAKKVDRALFMIRLFSFFRTDPEKVRPLMIVKPEYLQAAFDEIDKVYGDFDTYLEKVLGVSPERRQQLRALLTEPLS